MEVTSKNSLHKMNSFYHNECQWYPYREHQKEQQKS